MIHKAPVDETTKDLFLVAGGLVGFSVLAGAARAAVAATQAKLAQNAQAMQNALVTTAFFGLVFLAARAILEAP